MGLHVCRSRLELIHMERRFHNPHAKTRFTENRLPHRQQDGITYFVTFRLADSLPKDLLDQWRSERAAWLKVHPEPWSELAEVEYHRRFTAKFEGWLDEGHGSCLLRKPEVRAKVAKVLGNFVGVRYEHHSWVIMPNHVHLLFSLATGETLEKTLQGWKGVSSRVVTAMSSGISGRTDASPEGRHSCRPEKRDGAGVGRQECRPSAADGPVWMKDYFNRMIRDAEHFWRCVRYIRRNPVTANLRPGEFTLFESDHVRAVLDGKANG